MKRIKYILLLLIIFAISGCGKNNGDNQIMNKETEISTQASAQTTELTTQAEGTFAEEIPFNYPEIVDYMTLARLFEWENEIYYENGQETNIMVTGFEINDIDNDEKKELLMELSVWDSDAQGGCDNILFTFDSASGIYSECCDKNMEGDSYFWIDENTNQAYIENVIYGDIWMSDSFDCWYEDGWQTKMLLKKSEQDVEEAMWDEEQLSTEEWENRKKHKLLRQINNDLEDNIKVVTEASVDTVINTLNGYFTGKGLETTIVKKDDEEQYVIVNEYIPSTWNNKKNIERENESYTFTGIFGDHSYIFVARETDYGTEIFSDYIPQSGIDIISYSYSDGIVITTENKDFDFVYEIKDDDFVFARKVYYTDDEKELMSRKWYTITSEFSTNDIISCYEFNENYSGTYITYIQNDIGEWEEYYRFSFDYDYGHSSDGIGIFIDGDQIRCTFIREGECFVRRDRLVNRQNSGINGLYLFGYDSFPEFEDLEEKCNAAINILETY